MPLFGAHGQHIKAGRFARKNPTSGKDQNIDGIRVARNIRWQRDFSIPKLVEQWLDGIETVARNRSSKFVKCFRLEYGKSKLPKMLASISQ
jgi:hypothetical protein